jgi:hypothetical protein
MRAYAASFIDLSPLLCAHITAFKIEPQTLLFTVNARAFSEIEQIQNFWTTQARSLYDEASAQAL